jgi:hypothetical protein
VRARPSPQNEGARSKAAVRHLPQVRYSRLGHVGTYEREHLATASIVETQSPALRRQSGCRGDVTVGRPVLVGPRLCSRIQGTPVGPLVVVYILGVLAAAALVLLLLFLLVGRLASAAVTPSGRSARDVEPLDVQAASLPNEGLEAGEASGPTRKDVPNRASQQDRLGTQTR